METSHIWPPTKSFEGRMRDVDPRETLGYFLHQLEQPLCTDIEYFLKELLEALSWRIVRNQISHNMRSHLINALRNILLRNHSGLACQSLASLNDPLILKLLARNKIQLSNIVTVRCLGHYRGSASTELLHSLFSRDCDGNVKLAAAMELGKRGDTRGEEPLQSLLTSSSTNQHNIPTLCVLTNLGDIPAAQKLYQHISEQSREMENAPKTGSWAREINAWVLDVVVGEDFWWHKFVAWVHERAHIEQALYAVEQGGECQ